MDFILPRWNQLPDVDLYLEQVLSLLDQWLGGKLAGKNKTVMTKTMINNYVKQKILTPPVNKKYTKKTVAALFLIAYLKSIYSISDIARLIAISMEQEDMAVAYDHFCDVSEEAMKTVYEQDTGSLDYLMKNVAYSYACQSYAIHNYLEKPLSKVLEKK